MGLTPSNSDTNGKGIMKGSGKKSETISYSIYSDPAGTKPWGTAAGSTITQTSTGATQRIPIYISVLQAEFNKPSDHYNDVVAITMTY